MKIKTKYYYAEKGGYQTSNQYMILKDRYIIGLENQLNSTENGKPFYYDDTNYAINYGGENYKRTIVINKLITESQYTTKQREYLTRLTWFQQQKLLWMFKRHWLQQPGNMVHLLIAGLMVSLAFVGYGVINHHF